MGSTSGARHGAEGAPELDKPEVRGPAISRTGTNGQVGGLRANGVTDSRRESRVRLALCLKHVAEHVVRGGYSAIARRWNCSESLVRQLADPQSEKGGRIQSDFWFELPKAALAVYLKLVEDEYERGPLPRLSEEQHALRIAELAGKIAADVRANNAEALASDFAQLEDETATAQRDLKLVPTGSRQ